jgi:hypothetical protein
MTYFKLKDKYPNRKVTYTALVKAVSGNEYRTLQSVGDEFGVTRERVRQLLIKHRLSDVPSRQKPDRRKICRHCNNRVEMRYFISPTTRKKDKLYPASHQECRDKWSVNNWTEVQCTNCQMPIELRKSDARFRRRIKDWLFCSKKCATTYRVSNETDRFGTWAKSSNKKSKNHKYVASRL